MRSTKQKKLNNYIYLVVKLSIAHLLGHIYWTVGITAVNHWTHCLFIL